MDTGIDFGEDDEDHRARMRTQRALSRVSGISDLTMGDGLLLDEDDDDYSDGIIASQMQFSDMGGSQESDADKIQDMQESTIPVDDEFALVGQDPFNFENSGTRLEGDRVLSRRSAQRMTGEDGFAQSEMLFQAEQPTGVTDKLREGIEENLNNKKGSPTDSKIETRHVQISKEMEGLFQFIHGYKPKDLQISTILKPFVPDFIPAVGGVDEFIKIPRPDGQPDFLGLKVIDERGPKQSDAAVVNLQLRASSLQSSLHPLQVAYVENVDKNPKKLDAWINNIKDLHRTKPPPTVAYSKPMPSIESLLQEWPMEVDKALTSVELPSEKLDFDIATFADLCCAIVDIPVYKGKVESLHLIFSLFLDLKQQVQAQTEPF